MVATTAPPTEDFYDGIAPEYDSILSRPGDVWVRGAFQQFVFARTAPDARLLDFGCGTGIDAACYAARGHDVLAFDTSRGMLAKLEERCRDAMADGRIRVRSGEYSTFLAELPALGPFEAVVANFAVINLLPDLAAWFASLGPALVPGGSVLVSAYNPFSLHEWPSPRFWLRALRSASRPGVPVWHAGGQRWRFWPGVVARCAGGFTLRSVAGAGTFIRYDRGPHDWERPQSIGEWVEQKLWARTPFSRLGRFVFLEFRRDY